MFRLGAWEQGDFIGTVIFSRGNTPHIGTPFGLRQTQVCELTRVALGPHASATSRIVAIALKVLRRQSPGLKAVVSYADPERGHDGRGIYVAGNWLYVGVTGSECVIRIRGRLRHPRSVGSLYGTRSVRWLREHVDASAERIVLSPKHKYVFAFDPELRTQLLSLVQPYPKRPKEQAPARSPAGLEGASPIRPLHHNDAGAALV